MAGVLRALGLKQGGGSQMSVSRRIKSYGIETPHFRGSGNYRYTAEDSVAANERRRRARKSRTNRARYVFEDSRKRDFRRRREFGLTREFVAEALNQPCLYCGDTANLMTLDRIDNNVGHTDANCVPACLRCNLLRGDMPYEAWLLVAVKVREVREMGLFGDWLYRGS